MGVSHQLLLTLLMTVITLLTSTAQAQFTGCFTDPGCATLVVGGPSSNAEDCCVNNNAGLYYNDGGQCFQCIVEPPNSEVSERGLSVIRRYPILGGFTTQCYPNVFSIGVVIGFTQTVYQATEDVDDNVQLFVNVLMGELRHDVIVNFATEDGSALDGSGYTGVTQTLTFNEGTVSIPITVDIRRDDINEVLERFIGRLTTDDVDIILSPNVTTVEITDNDAVTVSFQQPIYMFAEGVGSETVCVEKVGATTQSISVMVTGPFQAETGNRVDCVITFAPDQFLQCIDFNITDDHIALEETEMFSWTLMVQGSPELVTLGDNSATDVLILDDDVLSLTVTKGDVIPESATTARTCITFSNQIARDVEVEISTQMGVPENSSTPAPAGIATPGVDFTTISAPLTLTPENSVTGERCFDIELLPDDIVEEDLECFTVELLLPEADRQSIILSGGTQICCIQDDDIVTIGFDPVSYLVEEDDGTVTLNVRIISSQLARPVEALVITEEASATSTTPADFINPGTVTLQFDGLATMHTVVINIDNDDIFENPEMFFANLVSFDPAVNIAPGRAEITIVEDPERNDIVTIGLEGDYSVTEGGVQEVCAVLVSGTLERDAIVTLSTADGSAIAPGDYSPLSVMLLMFNAGTTRACANLITETDQVVEGLETLELRLTTDDSAVILNPDTSNVKIVDTDSLECEELPSLGNGSILYHIGTTFLGTIAMYTCEDGFFLDGDNERNCTTGEAGSRMVWAWTGQEPLCVPLCNDLPSLTNGMIIYNVSEARHRTVATYTCDEGFQLQGDEIRTCEDGVWAEASPLQCAQEAPSLLSIGAVISIVIGSLTLIVALFVVVILLVALRYRKYKSQTSSINESSPPDMRPDVADELPDHEYDYISVGNSETSTEIPQPSTAGDDAAEVQFELTPCEAYARPVNPQPSTAGEDASCRSAV
ncbi:uncharacterized protein LOC135335909 isoform X6 [Halichondria panicea]|uniref:uncharacterized protein LOC135335909 isoform X6 n=1 Tax=Halichondria panicea TaxID=6063 RepID=UPI00312BA68C